MFDSLLSLIASIRPLSPEFRALHIWCERKLCNRLYFLEKGLARAYDCKNEQEVTAGSRQESNLIISVLRFFLQLPSYENIELLEDSIFISIHHQHLQIRYRQLSQFNFISRVFTEQY